MSPRRKRTAICGVALLAAVLVPVGRAQAAPSPAAVTVGVQGAASSTASFTGGPITGNADAAGTFEPPIACVAPTCESVPITVEAPATLPSHSITLSVAVSFDAGAANNPGDLAGMDIYLADTSGNLIAANLLGLSPETVSAAGLDAGEYIFEITGAQATVQQSYSAAVTAVVPTSGSLPPASTGAPVEVGGFGNEPLLAAAPDGTLYISALQHLYRSVDGGMSWREVSTTPIYARRANVASDSSISVAPDGRLYFTFDYPYAGITATCTSVDRAQTFQCDPATFPGGTDRMWVAAANDSTAYETTNEGLLQTLLFTSHDQGTTWVPTGTESEYLQPQTGPLLPLADGTVLQPLNEGVVGVYAWTPNALVQGGPEFRRSPLLRATSVSLIASTPDHTVYLASEAPSANGGKEVMVAATRDEGRTWRSLPPIPQTLAGTAVFSAVAAGSNGHVGVLYYYTTASFPDASAVPPGTQWSVLWSETFDAHAEHPTWTTIDLGASGHSGPICESLGCPGDARFAGDFISAVIDGTDTPRVTWMTENPLCGGGCTSIDYETIPEVDDPGAPPAAASRASASAHRSASAPPRVYLPIRSS